MKLLHLSPLTPKERILNFIEKADALYIPHISESVGSLDEYASKLSIYAESFFIAEDGQDIGYCALYANRSDLAFISTIGVMKDYQSKGIGGTLLNTAINFAKEKGFGRIGLEVHPSNTVAISLYQRFGFVEIEKRGRMIYMELRL